MLSLLRAQGIEHVLEDSSGNGGAAVAAYAAAGGMAATILTPASTSPAKTVQMRAHGATVELIPGSRQDTADAAVARSDSIFYASHNWHPFFLQGTKTLAYELWEDLGFRPPDNIITPCGAGSNVLGCEIGFSELAPGRPDRLPCLGSSPPSRPIAHRSPPRSWPVRTRRCQPHHPHHRRGDRHRPSHTAARGSRHVAGNHEAARSRLTEREIAEATLDLARVGIYRGAHERPGRRGVRQAAGDRDDHAGADDRVGDDGDRPESHAADRRTAGDRVVMRDLTGDLATDPNTA